MSNDRLDGFRGIRPDQLRSAYADRGGEDPRKNTFDRYTLGVAAEKFMAGIASPEDAKRVGREIVEYCEQTVRDSITTMLSEPDVTSQKAREAHFEGRVAGSILAVLNSIVASGHLAAKELTSEEEQS